MDVIETVGVLAGVLVGVATVYLMYRQNQILERTNTIMLDQGGAGRALVNSQGWSRRYWPMVVMGLLTVATWSAVAVLFLWTPDVNRWHSEKQETIYAKSFMNETIEIDGKKFDHCTFQNVKLMFHGNAPVEFVEARFLSGTVYLGSDNIAIQQFMILRQQFDKMLMPTAGWVTFDKNGNTMQQFTIK